MKVETTISLDSCVGEGSLAVFSNGKRVYLADNLRSEGSRVDIAGALEGAMGSIGLGTRDISRLIVTRGPGSFTGVRSGLSFARGFLRTGERELETCTVFEALMAAVPGYPRKCVVALFAGRSDVACKEFHLTERGVIVESSPGFSLCTIEEFLGRVRLSGEVCVVTEDRVSAGLGENAVTDANPQAELLVPGLSIAELAFAALSGRVAAGEKGSLSPVYTREFTIGRS